MLQDLFEYESSQMTLDLEAIMNAEMNSQLWPEKARAVGKCPSETGVMEMDPYLTISWSTGKERTCCPLQLDGSLSKLWPFEASRT